MQPKGDVIKRLANYMRMRREQGIAPFVLLLGAGASVPSMYPTGRQFVEDFLRESAVDCSKLDAEEKRQLFDELWHKAGEATVDAFIKRTLPPAYPSIGYQLVSLLAQEGYFKTVLTTNVDSLLDQAFAMVDPSLRKHQILSLPGQSPKYIADMLSNETPSVKIVKLHGDLRSGRFLFTPRETSRFSREVEDIVKQLLHRDLIVVGYSFEDMDVLRCMERRPSGIQRPSAYYVSPAGLNENVKRTLERKVAGVQVGVEVIDGNIGDFDQFISELYYDIDDVDPRGFGSFQSAFADEDLAGFEWVAGRYWTNDGCLTIGTPDSESIVAISPRLFWLGEAKISLEFQISQARNPDDWFGILLGAELPILDQGYLLYICGNGSVETRLPGGAVEVLGRLERRAPGWIRLDVDYSRDNMKVSVSSDGRQGIEASLPVPLRMGWCAYLWGSYSESSIKSLQVARRQ